MPRKTVVREVDAAIEEQASMRPRPDAAENRATRTSRARAESRFNEAAARCRGKPRGLPPLVGAASAASMRPRPDAAENRRPSDASAARLSKLQ